VVPWWLSAESGRGAEKWFPGTTWVNPPPMIGGAPLELLKRYIENQQRPHN